MISFIVVTWNQCGLLKACLESLWAQRGPENQIIVADNGSTDETADYLCGENRRLEKVMLAANAGYTGGNLAGYMVATGDIIALVNNDARLDPGWTQAMQEAMVRHPEAGLCASRIIQAGGEARLDSAGQDLLTSSRAALRGHGQSPQAFAEPAWVFGALGAAAAYRRRMLEQVGFLDPGLFFNCEDLDLSFRAQLAGWKCRYVPDALAFHAPGSSHHLLGAGKALFYWSRNCEIAWLKNTPLRRLLLGLPLKAAQEAATALRLVLRRGNLGAFLAGKAAFVAGLPAVLRQRRLVQQSVKLAPAEVDALYTPVLKPAVLAAKWNGLGSGALARLRAHQHLVASLVWGELRARYAGSFLGLGWSLLKPLTQFILYYVLFSAVLKVQPGAEYQGVPFPIWMLCGLLPTLFVSEVVARSPSLILERGNWVTKHVFQPEVLGFVAVLAGLVEHLAALLLLALLLWAYGYPPGWSWAGLIWYIPLTLPLILGMALALSGLNVFLRDLGQAVGLGVMVWNLATPVMYPAGLVPASLSWILAINPLYYLVEGYRAALLGRLAFDPRAATLYAGFGLAALALGFWLFRRIKPAFADVL